MSDLNERAAELLEIEYRLSGNGKLLIQAHPEQLIHIWDTVWHPDTDIAQAWMLVEKCVERDIFVEVNWKHGGWFCVLQPKRGAAWVGEGSTAAEAITAACVEALDV